MQKNVTFACVRGANNRDGMIVMEFKGKNAHSVGDQCQMRRWGKRNVGCELIGPLIDSKVQVSAKYSPIEITSDMAFELGLQLTYK